ncbi:small kinetochore-associated protein isoform X2 [Lithobates pipiens]
MMEKSRLPVPRPQTQKSSDIFIPCAKKTCPPKPVLPLYSKDPNIAFASTIPDFTMNKDGISGQVTRYKMESDLRDQNRLLEAANSTLHSRLLIAQHTIQEMSENQDTAQKELKELKQRLEKNLFILESRNIDPVTSEQILADEEETRKIREKTKTATENLLKELEQFSLTTKEQKALVQTVKAKWEEDEERRNRFLEEQKAFQIELEKFRSALEQTEQGLDL